MTLAGQRVLVTGASKGIGWSIARQCAEAGAAVALVARSGQRLERLAQELGGRAYVADLSQCEQVGELIARVENDGPVDILVNNAARDATADLTALTSQDVIELTQLNFTTPIELCRTIVPRMIERGGGQIVNISSLAATGIVPGMAVYSATKAALSHFSAGLRADLKGHPVGVTLVELGPVRTDLWVHAMSYPPTARSVTRLRSLGVLPEMDSDTAARHIVRAMEHKRRHVRFPRRSMLLPLLGEAPRRITELLLVGVKVHGGYSPPTDTAN
jgi:short-subunit dehydrogenase